MPQKPYLPAHTILLVEDQVRMAQELAILFQTWGAASVAIAPSITEALTACATPPPPTLVLIDHLLSNEYGCVVALWLGFRPALRQQMRVILYTNVELASVKENLFAVVHTMATPTSTTARLLANLSPTEQERAIAMLTAARHSRQACDALFHTLYDACFSKRMALHALRDALAVLT